MEDKKAKEIVIINLKKINNSITDYFVLATGTSNTHIDSIGEGLEYDVFNKFSEKPWNIEGIKNRKWVLIDYINVVAHIFNQDKRKLYDLEKLWGDGKILNSINEKG
tara:strand:+ start:658 stop:978 length:321 start_codon:yes stop_codon:yes gene_type:complete